MLVIDDTNVKISYSYKYTKLNGSAFSKEELADMVDYSDYQLIDSSEVDAFESELNQDPKVLKFEKFLAMDDGSNQQYQYYIYKLNEHNTLSNNDKTLTVKHDDEIPLSMHFGNVNDYEYNYFRTYELKLSKDGSKLYIFYTYKNDDDYDEWTDVYYRQ